MSVKAQILHAPNYESAMLKVCRLLLVSLCQLTEDLILVRNKLFKSFVGLGFVFLVFRGGRHWLLRLGFLLFVLPFFGGGCDYRFRLRGWRSPTFLRRCSLGHEELSLFVVVVVVNLHDVSPVLRNGRSVQWPFVLPCSAV